MKKQLLALTILSFSFLTIFSQEKAKKDSVTFYSELSIATRNVWRGASYGNSPSAQGLLLASYKNFEVGSFAAITINGSPFGYGNWIENYISYKYKHFTFTVDDYFFMNGIDSLNNFFEYDANKTQHLIEGRIKYSRDKFSLMAAYNSLYSNKSDKNNHAVYLEGEYFFTKEFYLIMGYITAPSSLSFYDKEGFTTIGAVNKKTIKVTDSFSIPLKTSLLFNPNYKNISKYQNLGSSPVNLVLAITF